MPLARKRADRCYFRMYEVAIDRFAVVEFLNPIKRPLLILGQACRPIAAARCAGLRRLPRRGVRIWSFC